MMTAHPLTATTIVVLRRLSPEEEEEEEDEEEEEEDAALPGPTSPKAVSDDDDPSKSKRTAAASRFLDDEAEDGGDDDVDDDDIQYNDIIEIPAKANDNAKDNGNDDSDEMSGGDGDVDFCPRDDPIDFDGPQAAADPRTADRPRHQRQSPFSPSSTPLDEPRRILCWNHVGVVTTPPAATATTSWTSPSTRPRASRQAEDVPSPSRTTWASSSAPSARRGGCSPLTSRRTTTSTTTGRTMTTSPGWGSNVKRYLIKLPNFYRNFHISIFTGRRYFVFLFRHLLGRATAQGR